jgi:hypothetical protein
MAFCDERENEGNDQRRNYLFVLGVNDAGHGQQYPCERAANGEGNEYPDSLSDCIIAYGAVSASHDEVSSQGNFSLDTLGSAQILPREGIG